MKDYNTGVVYCYGTVSVHNRGGSRKKGLHVIIPLNEALSFPPGTFVRIEPIGKDDSYAELTPTPEPPQDNNQPNTNKILERLKQLTRKE